MYSGLQAGGQDLCGFRQLAGRADQQGFLSTQLTLHDGNVTLGNFKQLAKPLEQVVIRLTIYRRGGDTQLEPITVQACNLIAGGFGLQLTAKNQVFALPAIMYLRQSGHSL